MRFRRFASVTLMPDTEEGSGSAVTRNSTPATVQAATQPPLVAAPGAGAVAVLPSALLAGRTVRT